MKIAWILPLGWVGALVSCASDDGFERPTGPVVKELEVEGADRVSESAIKKRLATSETPWWPFADKRRYDPVTWQTDLKRIERYYETRGFYQAEVVEAEVEARGKDEVALRVEVNEGEPVRIGEVAIVGLESLTEDEREVVMDDLPLTTGKVFVESQWEAAKAQISRALRDLGYAAATLASQAKLDVENQRARLEITVDPGAKYQFGEITVRERRDAVIDPARIQEQVALAIGKDRTFSEADLEEAQRRVFGMGVFSTARVSAGTPDASTGRVPVQVDVREAPFHTIRLGAGAAVDQVRQEARVLGGWADRNFLGGLRSLALQATAGWAFLPSTIAVLRNTVEEGPRNGPIYRATADFEQPRLFSAPSLRGKVMLESERTVEPAYDSIGGRSRVGVTWAPYSRLSIFPSYNLEGYRLNSPDPGRTATTSTPPLALGCEGDPCFVLLSYLEQSLTWDGRDHPLEPRRGFFASLSLQEGGGLLGGNFDYFRVMPEARAYESFGDDDLFTLAGRLRVGTLIPRAGEKDSPVVSRFYAGGPNSMRGFGLRRLSPMLLVRVDDKDENIKLAMPIGGNGLIEGSVEGRARVAESLLVATFFDFGTVTQEKLPFGELPDLMTAVGVGLRYLSPVGPIRLDFGFRLPFGDPPPLFDETGKQIPYAKMPLPGSKKMDTSCFGLGGNSDLYWVRDGLCAIHISIGEAF